jgi:tetratricopeptide (TPR) repeat protein
MSHEAISLLTALYGPTHSRLGSELSLLGEILDRENKLAAADSVHRAAVALLRRAYPSGSRELADALQGYGYHLGTTGPFDEAERVWRNAAAMLANGGAETLGYANALAQVGRSELKQGKYENAERSLREALAVRQSGGTQANPMLVRARRFLGEALIGQRKYAEAEPLLLDIVRAANASALDLLNVQAAASDLVTLYEAEGRPEESTKYRALATSPAGEALRAR